MKYYAYFKTGRFIFINSQICLEIGFTTILLVLNPMNFTSVFRKCIGTAAVTFNGVGLLRLGFEHLIKPSSCKINKSLIIGFLSKNKLIYTWAHVYNTNGNEIMVMMMRFSKYERHFGPQRYWYLYILAKNFVRVSMSSCWHLENL